MRGEMRQIGLAMAAATVLFVGACDREDRAQADSIVERAGQAIGAAGDTIAGRIRGREYSNVEMLGLINLVNDAEVEMGTMAAAKATDPAVRTFAQRLIADHRALKAKVDSSSRGLAVTPAAPSDDEDIAEDHQKAMQELTAQAKGREFDENFVEHEVRIHRKILDEIEDAIEGNNNPEIRALLEQARAGVQAHLTTAEELEKKFGT